MTEKFKIAAGYILICLIWGSTWLAIRVGLDYLPPLISSGIRFFMGSIFVFAFMKFARIGLQTDPNSMRLYLILAIFSFVIPFTLVYWAEQFIPSGLASIVFAIMPFCVIIFSKIAFPNEPVSFNKIFGVILGFTGIVIIFTENLTLDLSQQLFGILAVLVSSAMQAAIGVTIKKYGHHLNPLSMHFVPLFIAGLVLIISAFLFEDASKWIFNFASISSMVYLAFFGTLVAFTTYYWLLKRMNIVILSLSAFITPIVAVILGWVVLNENFSLQTLLGSAFVLIGILFANFRGLINYFNSKSLTA
ncbi:MAG: multidrug DMT transporter permease [Ignavibacteriae bacterium HGW-Ignavibacteriae-3]|nr:MAG: multidrug DMT transporter permease [Ignavibacteriae bacterium HGW-Ignavibacteriae-3]